MKNIKIKSPDTELVTVHTVSDPVQAELVKNMLADHGIKAELAGENQGGFTGTFEIEVIVKAVDAKRADEFINIHFPNV